MELKVRFRPQNTPDYPELVMIVKLDENTFNINSWTTTMDKERQILEEAAKQIREKLVNHDIISIERVY